MKNVVKDASSVSGNGQTRRSIVAVSRATASTVSERVDTTRAAISDGLSRSTRVRRRAKIYGKYACRDGIYEKPRSSSFPFLLPFLLARSFSLRLSYLFPGPPISIARNFTRRVVTRTRSTVGSLCTFCDTLSRIFYGNVRMERQHASPRHANN